VTSQPFPGIRIPTIRTLRPGLHLLETDVEDFDVRAAVLVGAERAVVWDTLAHPAQMREVAGLLRGRADRTGAAAPPAGPPALTVVYSHADWDHAWGTAGLADVEAVVAREEALERFATDVPEELRTRRELEPGVWDAVRLVPPDVTFTEHLTLDLGGATLRLHALPGHTPDSIVGWIPEWGVLLVGDAVEIPLPVVNDAAAVTGWIAGLRTWCADERVRVVVPAHGRVGGRELLDYSRVYLELLVEGRLPTYGDIPLPAFYQAVHARNLDIVSGTANRQRSPT
jgi:glyoxylase-like metal-dependent hydrolase (beta-lactamase superfamily II)